MGFITQAIAANFAPLLFLKFHNDYQIALGKIALISTCFFLTQLLVDLFCAKLGKIDSTGTDQGSQFLNRDGNIHILVAAVLHFRTGTLKFLCCTWHNRNAADITRIDSLALCKPGFNQRAEHLLRRFRRR